MTGKGWSNNKIMSFRDYNTMRHIILHCPCGTIFLSELPGMHTHMLANIVNH